MPIEPAMNPWGGVGGRGGMLKGPDREAGGRTRNSRHRQMQGSVAVSGRTYECGHAQTVLRGASNATGRSLLILQGEPVSPWISHGGWGGGGEERPGTAESPAPRKSRPPLVCGEIRTPVDRVSEIPGKGEEILSPFLKFPAQQDRALQSWLQNRWLFPHSQRCVRRIPGGLASQVPGPQTGP